MTTLLHKPQVEPLEQFKLCEVRCAYAEIISLKVQLPGTASDMTISHAVAGPVDVKGLSFERGASIAYNLARFSVHASRFPDHTTATKGEILIFGRRDFEAVYSIETERVLNSEGWLMPMKMRLNFSPIYFILVARNLSATAEILQADILVEGF